MAKPNEDEEWQGVREMYKAQERKRQRDQKMNILAHQCIKLTAAEGKYSGAWKAADEWEALRDGKDTDG